MKWLRLVCVLLFFAATANAQYSREGFYESQDDSASLLPGKENVLFDAFFEI